MYDFLPLLKFPLGALDETGLSARGVVVPASGEAPSEFVDASACLVDCYDVSCRDLFLGESLDHLSA